MKQIKSLPLIILLFLAIATGPQTGSAATRIDSLSGQPVLIRGPYLQQVTPNSVTIRWRTDIPVTGRVLFGTTLQYGGMATDTSAKTEHIITLTTLLPGRRYYYAIGTLQLILQGDNTNTFLTAPADGEASPVRIWATGDFGTGSLAQAAVRDAMMQYTGTIPVNLWVWLGDNAYWSGTDAEYQSFVFNMYPEQLKKIPLHPAPGNHDYANSGYKSGNSLTTNFPYFSTFTVPVNGEAGGIPSLTPKYYSYDYGNIHFLSLDSYGSHNDSTSAMYQWIEKDLKANTKRWTIVYFHHPPYSKGTHDSDDEIELIDMRTSIVPLLEKYAVDLVLSGHSHNNERSYFMKGHYGLSSSFAPSMKKSDDNRFFIKTEQQNGTVYAVCGTSGQNPGGHQPDYPMPCMYFSNSTDNCSMVIDIVDDFLTASYLTKSGSIADRFTIMKSGPGSATVDPFSVYQMPGNPLFSLNILLETAGDVSIEVINASGQTVYLNKSITAPLSQGFHRIEIDSSSLKLAKGIYIIKAGFSGKEYSEKVVIE